MLLPFVGLPRLDEEDLEEDPDSLVAVGDDWQDQVISQIDPGDTKLHTSSEDSLLSEIDYSSDSEVPLELDHIWSGEGIAKRYVIPMLHVPDDPSVFPKTPRCHQPELRRRE